MQRLRLTLIGLLALAATTASASSPHEPINRQRAGRTPAAAQAIKIATFNLRVFGKHKARRAETLSQLVDIIHKYDVVAIQELKDQSEEAPQLLLAAVNQQRKSRTYGMLLSERSGREPNDKASQEQYAVFYDTARIEPLSGARLYDDSQHDKFQRDPYVTRLRTRRGHFSFVLLGVHTRPESAVAEIGALSDVFAWAKGVFPHERHFIALGDFNAGCRYASAADLDALELRSSRYFWVVPDSSDSNVSPTSACAYDRIVTTAVTKDRFTGNWGVDRAFSDPRVSDHWPVWAEFAITPRARR